ncbi:hypothetical protein WMF41_34670 [Sorangium sp. So ce1151]
MAQPGPWRVAPGRATWFGSPNLVRVWSPDLVRVSRQPGSGFPNLVRVSPTWFADLKARRVDRLWVAALDVTEAAAVRRVVDRAFSEVRRIAVRRVVDRAFSS